MIMGKEIQNFIASMINKLEYNYGNPVVIQPSEAKILSGLLREMLNLVKRLEGDWS
jgi:hypothetical protein